MQFSNKTYDKIKWVIGVVLPAVSVAVAGLGVLYHVPNTDTIVATIGIVTIFLSTITGISTKNYNKDSGGNEDES